MNLLFVFDEYSDIENEYTVRQLGDVMMDTLHNPNKRRRKGESIIGEMTRQYVLIDILYAVALMLSIPKR
jgi:Delta6-protoilludene synthase